MSDLDFQAVGGKARHYGNGQVEWDFGYVTSRRRTREQQANQDAAQSLMPKFEIRGTTDPTIKKACLTDLWTRPEVVAAIGFAYPGTHQLTGSCFPAGVPVRMADGSEKPVEAVGIGDEVISHTGQGRKVVNTFNRRFNGDMVTLHVAGFAFPLTMTADHKMAVMRSDADWRWQPDRLEWVRAEDIAEGDRVLIGWSRQEVEPQTLDVAALLGEQCVILDDLMSEGIAPVSNIGMAQYICRRSGIDWRGRVKLVRSRSENALLRHVPVCPSLARLVGLYLAEGGCDSGRVVFSFDGRDEEPLAAEVLALVRGLFGVEGEMFRQTGRETVLKVRFTNQNLEKVFKTLVPGDVYSKRIPGLFFNANEETKRALILGWMDGDGYAAFRHGCAKKSARMQGVTASADLARDMTTLALSCGMRASCSRRKARKRSREAFDVFLSGPKSLSLFPALAMETAAAGVRTTNTDANRCRFGYARAVKRVERTTVAALPVFDFEVEEDHSFIAGGLISSNCVGAGGGNVLATLSFGDALLRGDPERCIVPFWLLPYGRSRYYMGDRGEGEGSTGSTFARAAREDGTLDAKAAGLPPFTNTDGLVWGSRVELKWSDGDNPDTMRLLPESRQHLVKTTAQCKSADDVRQAIINGYPCTCASSWGGGMKCPTDGNPAVLLNRRSGSWSHQMSIQNWWEHPSLGEIFWIQNQWGLGAHGSDPAGGPGGGFWVKKGEIDWICRDEGEVYAFSQFEGFPSNVIPWIYP